MSDVANIDPTISTATNWTFGSVETVPGTGYAMVAAYATQSYRPSTYDKEASSIRNYLFIQMADKSSHWLLPSNRVLILSNTQLPESSGDKPKPVRWIEYRVVTADTNKDGRLSTADTFQLAYSDGIGNHYTEVLNNVEEITGSTTPTANSRLIFYKHNGRYLVAEIDIPSRRVTVTKELPPIQP